MASDEESINRQHESAVDVEKLGRQRPEVFKSIWAELGFGISVFCSMLLAASPTSPLRASIRL